MLRDRNTPPVYKLAEYLIQNSMLDVYLLICSMFKKRFTLPHDLLAALSGGTLFETIHVPAARPQFVL